MPEEKIVELLACGGEYPVKSFNLIRDKDTGQSKGYGFATYHDGSVVDTVCHLLHGTAIQDKTLTVRRANDKKAGAAPAGAPGRNAEMPAPGTSRVIVLVSLWFFSIDRLQLACFFDRRASTRRIKWMSSGLPGRAHTSPAQSSVLASLMFSVTSSTAPLSQPVPHLLQRPLRPLAVRISPLVSSFPCPINPSLPASQANAVSREELLDDGEYNEILEDMYKECSKYGGTFGRLMKITIPRPSPDPSQPDPSGVGKILIEYSSAAAAAMAVQALHGRNFGDSVVSANFMEEHAYLAGHFG